MANINKTSVREELGRLKLEFQRQSNGVRSQMKIAC